MILITYLTINLQNIKNRENQCRTWKMKTLQLDQAVHTISQLPEGPILAKIINSLISIIINLEIITMNQIQKTKLRMDKFRAKTVISQVHPTKALTTSMI